MSNSRIGTILVDIDVLASVFHFPEGYTVVDVRRIDSTPFRKIEVLCSGPTLPEVADGADIPQVRYMITQTESGEMVRKREYTGTFDVIADKCDAPPSLPAHEQQGSGYDNAYIDVIDGMTVPVVNVPYHYASDTAHALLQKYPEAPFAACWFRRGDGMIQYSLRSEDRRVDVSEVAKKFGGGGHRNAAGYQVAS